MVAAFSGWPSGPSWRIICSSDGLVALACDTSKAAGDLAYNPEHHPKTKHIDRRHFYIRECVENHRLRVPFVNSHDNLADFFTKPLNAKNFFRLRDIIMNVQHDPPTAP